MVYQGNVRKYTFQFNIILFKLSWFSDGFTVNDIKKVNQVDIFSIVFMIVGVPVGIFGIYIIDKIGLKWSMWVAVSCNTLGQGSIVISDKLFGRNFAPMISL